MTKIVLICAILRVKPYKTAKEVRARWKKLAPTHPGERENLQAERRGQQPFLGTQIERGGGGRRGRKKKRERGERERERGEREKDLGRSHKQREREREREERTVSSDSASLAPRGGRKASDNISAQ